MRRILTAVIGCLLIIPFTAAAGNRDTNLLPSLKQDTLPEVKTVVVDTTGNTIITNDGAVFEKVEVEASFAGGTNGWINFLQQTLNSDVPVRKKAPVGTYTVVVQFIVDKKGKIAAIKALTSHGYGMEKEVIRVMKKSPDWLPAMQNGKPVNAYRKQPITFVVQNG